MKIVVICAMPRSGSTMLAEALIRHPSVFGFTEIFNHDDKLRQKCHQRTVGDEGLFAYAPDGIDGYTRPDLYLDLLEAMAVFRGKSALSFKLMESQAPALYAELQRRPDARMIYTHRENIIMALASYKIALATGVWHLASKDERPEPATKVALNLPEIADWAKREAEHLELVRRTKIPRLELKYSEILANPKSAVARMFSWAGIMECIEVPQAKLNGGIEEMVSNLEELSRLVAGTNLEWMLSGREEPFSTGDLPSLKG